MKFHLDCYLDEPGERETGDSRGKGLSRVYGAKVLYPDEALRDFNSRRNPREYNPRDVDD